MDGGRSSALEERYTQERAKLARWQLEADNMSSQQRQEMEIRISEQEAIERALLEQRGGEAGID